MGRFKFGVCEFSFPCWGPLALQMAHEAGFTGMQLADAGGSTNSYPLNNKRVPGELSGGLGQVWY